MDWKGRRKTERDLIRLLLSGGNVPTHRNRRRRNLDRNGACKEGVQQYAVATECSGESSYGGQV